MELTKQDTQKAKGVAVLGMVMLHLFCRLGELPYAPLLWCSDVPLIYYLGLFGDFCVPIFCFCSGYAHFLMVEVQGKRYCKRIPGKALRFLCNYWIVVLFFSLLGLVFDKTGSIPGSFSDFLGNMLVVGMNYNGAWWFVVTYLILLALSPVLAAITRRVNGILLLAASGGLYFGFYMLRFNYPIQFDNAVINWVWQQIVLLGTSQFGYLLGMVVRRACWVTKLRECLQYKNDTANVSAGGVRLLRIAVRVLPAAAFLGHCVVQSLIVAPLTAASVLICLFTIELPSWANRFLLLMGKHSTNIWLVHMFFYQSLFTGFAFRGRYPVFVLALMLGACFLASLAINAVYHPVLTRLDRKLRNVEV